jgi:hypothetical protein
MLSRSEQLKMAKDLRVIANRERLPFWIFVISLLALVFICMGIAALVFLHVLLKSIFGGS